jgi:hypothetical protein
MSSFFDREEEELETRGMAFSRRNVSDIETEIQKLQELSNSCEKRRSDDTPWGRPGYVKEKDREKLHGKGLGYSSARGRMVQLLVRVSGRANAIERELKAFARVAREANKVIGEIPLVKSQGLRSALVDLEQLMPSPHEDVVVVSSFDTPDEVRKKVEQHRSPDDAESKLEKLLNELSSLADKLDRQRAMGADQVSARAVGKDIVRILAKVQPDHPSVRQAIALLGVIQ